jgi:hypothetical protein
MNGDTANLAYLNLQKDISWRFDPDWPGQRCGAQTRRGTDCIKPALKGKNRCQLHGGKATGARTIAGRQRLSDAQLRHGKYTKDKLAAQRHRAKVGRRVIGELKRLEGQIVDAGLCQPMVKLACRIPFGNA